jgi:hypothetical protein
MKVNTLNPKGSSPNCVLSLGVSVFVCSDTKFCVGLTPLMLPKQHFDDALVFVYTLYRFFPYKGRFVGRKYQLWGRKAFVRMRAFGEGGSTEV